MSETDNKETKEEAQIQEDLEKVLKDMEKEVPIEKDTVKEEKDMDTKKVMGISDMEVEGEVEYIDF